jgi:hypothetical protein
MRPHVATAEPRRLSAGSSRAPELAGSSLLDLRKIGSARPLDVPLGRHHADDADGSTLARLRRMRIDFWKNAALCFALTECAAAPGGGGGHGAARGTILGIAQSSGSSWVVARVDLATGASTDLFTVTPPPNTRVAGVTKRPDGTLDVVEIEGQFQRTHLVQIDEQTGATLGDRVVDGGASPGDYAPDGRMWLGSFDSISSHLSTLGPTGAPTAELDVGTSIVDDVACVGSSVYVLSSDLVDGALVYTLSAFSSGALQPLAAPAATAMAPAGSTLVLVTGWQLTVIDPAAGTVLATVPVPHGFLDVTEE